MKDRNMLIWLTQLGFSTALPPTVLSLLGVWLHRCRGWGVWTVWSGLILGLVCAGQSFRDSLKAMARMSEADTREPPPASYNDHK